MFAVKKPHRVLSVVLINSFCDTSHFTRIKPTLGFGVMPEFYLKKIVLENFNQQAMDKEKVAMNRLSSSESHRVCLNPIEFI